MLIGEPDRTITAGRTRRGAGHRWIRGAWGDGGYHNGTGSGDGCTRHGCAGSAVSYSYDDSHRGCATNGRCGTHGHCTTPADIVAQRYDLSLNRYKEVVHEEVDHRPPKEVLTELGKLEEEIQQGMKELEGMLK